MAKLITGENDLATLFPEIAKEADGWDPTTLTKGSTKKLPWRCTKGHTWEATPNLRTFQNTGCPYCAGQKAWPGFNDIQTLYPDIAKEAHNFDPTTTLPGSGKKRQWKCKLGHVYELSADLRCGQGQGCRICSNRIVLEGFNDLGSKFPTIASEADGWDPKEVIFGSNQNRAWKCNLGHTYIARISHRTQLDSGCPYCAGQKVWAGFNDLATKFPEVAKEAHNWDTKRVSAFSSKIFEFKCTKGHLYKTSVAHRTGPQKSGCPYCASQKVLTGFNDLQTLFPDIAKEAEGWDPSKILPGIRPKRKWKCIKCSKIWESSPGSRTGHNKSGCPYCVEFGFNPGKEAYFYLMGRPGEQQFGITNTLERRLKTHESNGWQLIESTGPHDGKKIMDTEKNIKNWLKSTHEMPEGKTENWYSRDFEVSSLSELFISSGVQPLWEK